MSLLVDSLVRRHMKQSSHFTMLGAQPLPAWLSLPLHETEVVIGWYCNPAPWSGSMLVFTSSAIWTVEGGSFERIALRDIEGYETPADKVSPTGVTVLTTGGPRFLRAAGAYGPAEKFKDFWLLIQIVFAVKGKRDLPD